MIEVMISTVLVGTLMVTAMSASGFHAANSRAIDQMATAQALSNRLLAEVIALRFAESASSTTLGVDSGETLALRQTWDDVDDANGYSSTPPKSRTGSSRTDMTGWTEAVSVGFVSVSDLSSSSTATPLKRVTVTITTPASKQVTATALVTDLPYPNPTTTSASRLSTLEVNSTQYASVSGPMINLRNEPSTQ